MKKKQKRRLAGPHHTRGQQVKQVRQAKLLTYENVTSPHATTTTNVYYVTNESTTNLQQTKIPPCAPSCFLRSILRRTKRLLEKQFEVREDLEDLLQNESALREATKQKINAIEITIKEHSLKAQKLQNCLDNGCDDCFPETGTPYE
jgi:hypothetical protein